MPGRAGTAVLLAATVMVAGLVLARPAAAASPVLDNFVARHSSQCLDVSAASKADGAPVVQWDCLGEAQTNQRLKLEMLRGICSPGSPCPTYYKLRPRHSGKCIEVQGASTAAGAPLVQVPCRNYAPSQEFTVQQVLPGLYNLVLRHSGMCVDVGGGWVGNGVSVGQWPCLGTGQTNQQFSYTQSTSYLYDVAALHSGRCLEVQGASTAAGAPVVQAACVPGKASQSVTFYRRDDGFSTGVFKHSGMCLDIAGGATGNGAALTQWPCLTGQLNQQFSVVAADGFGYYNLVARHSGRCVDVLAANVADGAAAGQWDCLGPTQTNQTFTATFYVDPPK